MSASPLCRILKSSPLVLYLAALTACQLPAAPQSYALIQTETAAGETSLTPLSVSITGYAPTPEKTSTPTPPPPTATPKGTPSPTPPSRVLADGSLLTYATPPRPPVTPIPPAAAPVIAPNHITTVLLLGSDQRPGRRGNATDTIIVVAVNRQANAVNMLSIPRDTYVYIPGWTMDRVNTALIRGEVLGVPGGGIALLRETMLYNFGIEVDYYARVDFEGFKQVVDTVGGVDVPVPCELTDWRLISPELDINDPANWEEYTLGAGLIHMDGDLALWYARSRLSTSDFDRNRRQQQILRALWRKSQGLDLVSNLPALWSQLDGTVETDMQLPDMVALAPVALNIEGGLVRGRSLSETLSGWRTPDTQAAVQLPDLEQVPRLVEWLYLEPGVYAVASEASRVEVLNGTTYYGWDTLAAEHLGWEGLSAIPAGETDQPDQEHTEIFDYTGQVKGTSAAVLARVLNVPAENITVQPDPDREVDFRVIIGYDYDSCPGR